MNAAAPRNHRWFIAAIFVVAAFFPEITAAQSIESLLSRPPSKTVGAVAIDLGSGKELFSLNQKMLLKPASILKLAVSYAAFKEFTPDYFFKTDFFLSGKGNAKDLIVKGGGDPSMTNESLFGIANDLKNLGLTQINNIILDTSLFASTTRQGGRAYESGANPLSLNYNSIKIWACRGVDGVMRAGADPESYAPKIGAKISGGRDSVLSMGSFDGPGTPFSITGTLSKDEPCVTVYRSVQDINGYFGIALRDYLTRAGIKILGSIENGTAVGEPFYTYRSKSLTEIIAGLNHFSTNMIADTLIYLLGSKSSGDKREAGLAKISGYLKGLGISTDEFHLEDASGLSHENRITAHAILRILEAALSDPTIAAEYASSLSVLGRSGTLKRRNSNDGEVFMRGKTGSLDGVSSLAGEIVTKKGNRVLLAIIENQIPQKDDAVRWEDAIVRWISYAS